MKARHIHRQPRPIGHRVALLYPYQQAVIDALRHGHRNIVVLMPRMPGKATILRELAR